MSRRLARPVPFSSVATPTTRISPAQRELDAAVADEDELDFPIEELREFLSADLFEVPADPRFKERLRQQLWNFLRWRNPGGD